MRPGRTRPTHSRRSSGAPPPPHTAPVRPRPPTTLRGVALQSAGFKISESPQAARWPTLQPEAALSRRRPHSSYGKPMPPDGPTLGSVSCECVECTVRTADRIDEALSVILSQTCRTFNETFPDRVQTTTPLTVSGPTVVRKGSLEQLIRTRSNGKV